MNDTDAFKDLPWYQLRPTILLIDMACGIALPICLAIARGADWLALQCERGIAMEEEMALAEAAEALAFRPQAP